MKCQNCGAEIDAHSTTCTYCGATVSAEMKKEQEQLLKKGCPKCGSSNITFSREKLGDYKVKQGTAVVRSTVGLCKDCGYTWNANEKNSKKKSNKWLWILGWICIFPLPLTMVLLRKKDMEQKKKYGIIAAAWILYLIIVVCSSNKKDTSDNSVQEPTSTQTEVNSSAKQTNTDKENVTTEESITETSSVPNESNNKKKSIILIAGELGEYGQELVLNEGSEFEEINYCYFVPAGKYTVTNIGTYDTQVDVNKNEKSSDTDADGNKIEYWADSKAYRLEKTASIEITVEDGYFIEIEEPTHIELIPEL